MANANFTNLLHQLHARIKKNLSLDLSLNQVPFLQTKPLGLALHFSHGHQPIFSTKRSRGVGLAWKSFRYLVMSREKGPTKIGVYLS
ncbi:hypothetical protein BHE90_017427 [Fusarium euwallaceae]|uniref:Uncharacterized protein n=1 Tax=Fusarium euwallaceae TaxID=1147111 RepID=A0A430KXK6_9HYPO|nr:hypothetical protein BHE90_017427 [Fusarium euwallaceae]